MEGANVALVVSFLMNFVQFGAFGTNLVPFRQHLVPFRQDFVTIWLLFGYPLTKIKKMKVPRINYSIRESLSELKSSLFGLFRPSHLPYKAKSEKMFDFCIIFLFSHIFPIIS